ncbi:hypothetical protein ATO6_08480 [Oceanicola sp. 22II-s10i]|nr:hypothetical protein ATO6_08480 [Oceanicola sp. 22II-s10i]
MADSFAGFIPSARAFLTRLRAENTRDWFTAHKAEYDETIRRPALLLLETMQPELERITGTSVSQKLFRPQRDIRFSADRTPYKDHCHMLWHAPSGTEVGYYFGISPDYVRIGAGVMGFEKKALDRWRRLVDSDDGAEIADALAALRAAGCDLSEPERARVPAPYDRDHPRGDLLRRKSLTVWRDADLPVSDLPATLATAFAEFAPLCTRLAAVA